MTPRGAGTWPLVLVLAGLVGLMGACGRDAAVSGEGLLIERRPNLAYEELFPHYVELCVTSQYRSKTKGRGGPAGHALMYIKGACKDEDAPFPQLRRCRSAATTLDDPAKRGPDPRRTGYGLPNGLAAKLKRL